MKKEINDLQNEISYLKSQLTNIKYLNAEEVKVLTRGLLTEIKYYDDLFSDPNCPNTNHKEIEENLISLFIRDICKLAIPDIISVDNLSKELGMRDLTKEEAEIIDNHIEKLIKEDTILDIDRDKIIKILHEFVVYQMEADNLIHNQAVEYVADEIIKAIRSEE